MLRPAFELLGHWSNSGQHVPAGDVRQASEDVLRPLFESADTPKPPENVRQSSDYKYPTGRTSPVKDLSPGTVMNLTRHSKGMNFDSKAFQGWVNHSGLERKEGESDMAFAHRGFAYIKHHFTYQWPTPNHSPTETCTGGRSDCSGLSATFVSLMRTNGVPARLLGGRWAASQEGTDIKSHVKAEFFARGVGWVPVDMSAGVGDTSGGGDFAHFGHDGGDFIAFANAEDCVMDSFDGKDTVGLFQGIACWWHGSGPDKNNSFKETWTVQKR